MKRTLLYSLLVTLAVWTVFSWPLPRHVRTAIPYGYTLGQPQEPGRQMVPGDHLQLLYHFWLFSDMVAGRTPWMHNQYEFNTGDDAERLEPGSYYVPFSLFFTIGQALGGPAVGWNLAAFLALWLTYLGTILLVRRFTEQPFAIAVCALLAIVFPYRWINVTTGSPTGFGIMWVPWLLLGLDIAVREGRLRGGLLAGFAILITSWGDAHVFFFSSLLIPCWCLFALAGRPTLPGRDLRGWLRMALAVSPVALGAAVAVVSTKLMNRGISSSRLSAGRPWSEVALFSPHAEGLLSWRVLGASNQIYIGYALGALLLLGLWLVLRRGPARQRLLLALLIAGVAGIVVLALGPFGPLGGRAFAVARKVIPQYVLIRQPLKIFCLLPSLTAVAAALLVTLCTRRALRWAVLGLLLAAAVEIQAWFTLGLCPLEPRQAAYAAAAAVQPARPAALVLPLWPGDSDYTSVYQYFATQQRLRMVNGYRPFVSTSYVERVFHRFESANQGALDDSQLDELLAMKVPALLLHENLIPEKVSPFPVGRTLKQLLNNPRLTLLAQDGPVWAFRIEQTAQVRPPVATNWTTLCSSRQFDATRLRTSGDRLVTRPFTTLAAPDQRWLIRARGEGEVEARTVIDDGTSAPQTFSLHGTNWQWLTAPQAAFPGLQSNYLALARRGQVEVDHALFAAGPWTTPARGESLTIPAPCFFHSGYTDLKDDTVVFRAARDQGGLVFYGPKLPLDPGRYTVTVSFSSPAATGTALGQWFITCPEGRELKLVDVRAGQALETSFDLDSNQPLLMIFKYFGTGDVRLKAVTLTRDG